MRVRGGIRRNVGAAARAPLPASSLHSFPGPLFPESPPPPDTRAEFSSLTRSLLPPQGRALLGLLSKSWECSVRLEQESCREKGSGKDKGPGAAWLGVSTLTGSGLCLGARMKQKDQDPYAPWPPLPGLPLKAQAGQRGRVVRASKYPGAWGLEVAMTPPGAFDVPCNCPVLVL